MEKGSAIGLVPLRLTLKGALIAVAVFSLGCSKLKTAQVSSLMGSSGISPVVGSSSTTTTTTTLPPNGKVFVPSPQVSHSTYSPNGPNSTELNFDGDLVSVRISGTSGGILKNSDINVMTNEGEDSNRAHSDSSGKWFFSSSGDPKFSLGQLMMYYWIDLEKNTFEKILPGQWKPSGKNINAYSRCYDGLNAYWAGVDSNYICMGYVGYMQLSFDACVFDHEMGHAHAGYNTNGDIEGSASSNGGYCTDAEGCAGAINEGQADVHCHVLLNKPEVGAFTWGAANGFPGRNAEENADLTASGMANQTTEIHSMGSVWAAAWWTLRKSLGNEATDLIFANHLQYLHGEDTFGSGLTSIILADQKLVDKHLFSANHKDAIVKAFAHHGISPK